MSKDTKILDYAKYMETVSEKASIILDNKNISNSRGKSLTTKIGMFDELAPLEKVEKHEEPLFKKLREDYEKDPLLTRNGGDYKSCQYQVIPVLNADVKLYRVNALIITSDGQELQGSGSAETTLVFDSSKDLTLEDGTKARWVKMYFLTDAVGTGEYYYNLYYSLSSSANLAYFMLLDANRRQSGSSTGRTTSDGLVQIRELVFGHNYPEIVLTSSKPLLYTYNMTQPLIYYGRYDERLINWLFNEPNNITLPFAGELKYNTSTTLYQRLYNRFGGDSLTTFTLSYIVGDVFDLSANPTFKYYTADLFSSGQRVRKLILNPNGVISKPSTFLSYSSSLTEGCLTDIVFYDGIDIPDLSFAQVAKLNRSSILDLFNKLKDRSNEEPANIILGNYNINKVTDEEKLIAINKNWTLS